MRRLLLAIPLLLPALASAQPAVSIDAPDGTPIKVTRGKTDGTSYQLTVPLSAVVSIRGVPVQVSPGATVTVAVTPAPPPPSVAMPPLPGMSAEQTALWVESLRARVGKLTDVTRDTVLCPDRVPVLVGPTP